VLAHTNNSMTSGVITELNQKKIKREKKTAFGSKIKTSSCVLNRMLYIYSHPAKA